MTTTIKRCGPQAKKCTDYLFKKRTTSTPLDEITPAYEKAYALFNLKIKTHIKGSGIIFQKLASVCDVNSTEAGHGPALNGHSKAKSVILC